MKTTSRAGQQGKSQQPGFTPGDKPEDRPEPKRVIRQTESGKLNTDSLSGNAATSPAGKSRPG